jgi:hypothetical protein
MRSPVYSRAPAEGGVSGTPSQVRFGRRCFMNRHVLSACSLILGVTMALAAPPSPVTSDPNVPEKTREIISREEREQLGLAPRTWTGVVQPEVYTTLERLNRTVERLKKTRTGDAVRILFAVQLRGAGKVYVQIQLKHDPKGAPDSEENMAAIRDVQRRVLRSLTAAELHRPFLFQKAPALTAYVTMEALDKLAKNPDVLGVCLDEAPLPYERERTAYDDLPPAEPGDSASTQPGVAEMRVDPDVYRALDLTDRVEVMIAFRGDSLPKVTAAPSRIWVRARVRDQVAEGLQDRILSTLNADEFWDLARIPGAAELVGSINRAGLDKIRNHPDLVRIALNRRIQLRPPAGDAKP